MSLDYNRFSQSMYDCQLNFQMMMSMLSEAQNARLPWYKQHRLQIEQYYTQRGTESPLTVQNKAADGTNLAG